MDPSTHINRPNALTSKKLQQQQPPPLTINESHGNRNANMDALRGIAIIGILFMNIFFMNNSFYGYAQHYPQIQSDIILEVFSNFFLEGRFISLLSILFGAGLYIQYKRYEAASLVAYPLLKRRIIWLAVFGLLHGIFIWGGDILLSYAFSAFLALNYLNGDITQLKKRANQFIVGSLLVMALLSLLVEPEYYYRGSEFHLQQLQAWSANYSDIVLLQLNQVGYMLLIIPLTLMWFLGGLMMWGMALYQQGAFEHGLERTTLIKCAIAAIILSSLDSLLSFSSSAILVEFSAIVMMLSAIPMALIYLHLIVKACQDSTHVLAPFQAVGKLAFSCYILQSIIGVSLFRYLMPELNASLDRVDYILIALGLSGLQLLLAPLYLRYFSQGPLESLWRKLVSKK
ncbi:DUF418 domain-containing protein [Shewanella sp. 10N.286.48.A6]|uniref:DUF418 domain-containing protein n=1 Tax=Shewanella sp. 10N.286.48.A6 TaxID=1880833 RepID=UPI001F538064|nr:DUF418 domain-containing protein [Shewanella sp. 10N.286.48.A6]